MSSTEFMGRSFPLMGALGFHRIGMDRPAISAPHHMAVFGWHNQRDSVPPSLNAGRAGGGLLFHNWKVPMSYTIEKGVPMPSAQNKRSGFTETLLRMEPSDSVFFGGFESTAQFSSRMNTAKSKGYRFNGAVSTGEVVPARCHIVMGQVTDVHLELARLMRGFA